MKTNTRILLLVLVLALALPFLANTTWQGILTKMLIAALFATGYNLLLGQAGLLSFGHAAFYGIGAIATLHVMIAVERGVFYVPLPLIPLTGALAGLVLAFIAGCFATKRSGTYFALVTLAMAELIHVIAPSWEAVFGGEAGLTSMRMPSLGLGFGSALEMYFFVLAWVAVGIGGLWYLSKTAFGQLTLALNGNEQRLKFLGFDTYKSKVLIFSISGMIAGLSGSLLAITNETANYTLFSVTYSTQVIFHTFIGGQTLFFGPAIAAAALTAMPFELSNYTHFWPLYQGLLFMVVMLTAPGGLGVLLRDQWHQTWDRYYWLKVTKVTMIVICATAVVVACAEWAGKLRHGGLDMSAAANGTMLTIFVLALAVLLAILVVMWRFPAVLQKVNPRRGKPGAVSRGSVQ